MIGKKIKNLFVIELVSKVGQERIYRTRCVCGKVGKITETGLRSRVSCGCSTLVRPHLLGLRIGTYTFVDFVGERGKVHMYVIDCSLCSHRHLVDHRYRRPGCPGCSRKKQSIPLVREAERLGIHPNALAQRLDYMGREQAIEVPRKATGGHRGRHGRFPYLGYTDTVMGHLRRLGKKPKRGSVYYWIKRGMDPVEALSFVLSKNPYEFSEPGKRRRVVSTQQGLEILDELFPSLCAKKAC